MKTIAVNTVILLAGVALLGAAPASALNVDELIDLCKAGYSTADILKFVETLGLDDPIDSDAVVKLKEEGCSSDLAVELMRYGSEEDEEISGEEPSNRVHVYAGRGYPYSWGWDSYWTDWYSPWWGVHAGWYDPWYWDSWYWPRYHYARYYGNWSYDYHYWDYRPDRRWRWCRSDYGYDGGHSKAVRARSLRSLRAATFAGNDGYRAKTSRATVSRAYKGRTEDGTRAAFRDKTNARAQSKADYRIKSKSGDRTVNSGVRATRRGTENKGTATKRDTPSQKRTYRAAPKSRSSSGTIGPSGSPRASGRSSTRSRASGSTRATPQHRGSAPSSSGGKSSGYSGPPPSSSGNTGSSSGSSSPPPRARRR